MRRLFGTHGNRTLVQELSLLVTKSGTTLLFLYGGWKFHLKRWEVKQDWLEDIKSGEYETSQRRLRHLKPASFALPFLFDQNAGKPPSRLTSYYDSVNLAAVEGQQHFAESLVKRLHRHEAVAAGYLLFPSMKKRSRALVDKLTQINIRASAALTVRKAWESHLYGNTKVAVKEANNARKLCKGLVGHYLSSSFESLEESYFDDSFTLDLLIGACFVDAKIRTAESSPEQIILAIEAAQLGLKLVAVHEKLNAPKSAMHDEEFEARRYLKKVLIKAEQLYSQHSKISGSSVSI